MKGLKVHKIDQNHLKFAIIVSIRISLKLFHKIFVFRIYRFLQYTSLSEFYNSSQENRNSSVIQSKSKVDEPGLGIDAIAETKMDLSNGDFLIYQTKASNYTISYLLVPPYVQNFSNSSHLTQQYTPYNQQQHTCNSRSDQNKFAI